MAYRAALFFDKDNAGNIYQMDVIEYQGGFWLVPAWFEFPDQQERQPVRIVALWTLRHQDNPNSGPLPRFLVNEPLSRGILEGRKSPIGTRYVVIERPDIRLPLIAGRAN